MNNFIEIFKGNRIISKMEMLKILIMAIFMFGCVALFSCKDSYWINPRENVSITLDNNFIVDANGYSIFVLYNEDGQSIHSVSGKITVNGKIPYPPKKVEWESSHYWRINAGDTLGTIYRRTWRGLGWQIVDSITFQTFADAIVPTINPVSYSTDNGTIHSVIAPVWDMRGDTLTILARYKDEVSFQYIILK